MTEQIKQVTDLPADRLRSLISRVKEKGGSGGSSLRPRRDPVGPQPLSFAQERLWFLDRLGAGGAAYAIPSHVRLSGPLDAEALARTFAELVRRHESLRTTFGERRGVPFQEIPPAMPSARRLRCRGSTSRACPAPSARGRCCGSPARRRGGRSIWRADPCCATCWSGSVRKTTSWRPRCTTSSPTAGR